MGGLGVTIKIGVQASCGHSWTETRPPNVAPPVNGELRVCGHPECYPKAVEVTYSEPVAVDLEVEKRNAEYERYAYGTGLQL